MPLLASCALPVTTSERMPANYYINQEMTKPQTHVDIQSNISLAILLSKLIEGSKCVLPKTGGLWATYEWSVEYVKRDDGDWLALRMDAYNHSYTYFRMDTNSHFMPTAVRLSAIEGATQVKVTRANKNKASEIKALIENGTYFCHWREVSYPWD